MGVPTTGEVLSRIIDSLRKAQEDAYLMGHLTKAMSNSSKDRALGDGWIAIGEMLKRMNHQVIEIGKGKLQ